MINLETISRELTSYKEAKEKSKYGEWHAIKDDFKFGDSLGYNIKELDLIDGEFGYGLLDESDANFIALAKNTPIETYCEQLIEEIIDLRAKLA